METLSFVGLVAFFVLTPLCIWQLFIKDREIRAYRRWSEAQMERQEAIVKMICEKNGVEVPEGTRMAEQTERK